MTIYGRKAQKKTERTYNYSEVSFVLDHENIETLLICKREFPLVHDDNGLSLAFGVYIVRTC